MNGICNNSITVQKALENNAKRIEIPCLFVINENYVEIVEYREMIVRYYSPRVTTVFYFRRIVESTSSYGEK